eukprot:2700046-Pleurochrysis_carterae.AAC.3
MYYGGRGDQNLEEMMYECTAPKGQSNAAMHPTLETRWQCGRTAASRAGRCIKRETLTSARGGCSSVSNSKLLTSRRKSRRCARTRSATPCRRAKSRKCERKHSWLSTPMTSQPRSASQIASLPFPQPKSTARSASGSLTLASSRLASRGK